MPIWHDGMLDEISSFSDSATELFSNQDPGVVYTCQTISSGASGDFQTPWSNQVRWRFEWAKEQEKGRMQVLVYHQCSVCSLSYSFSFSVSYNLAIHTAKREDHCQRSTSSRGSITKKRRLGSAVKS